MFHPFSYLQRPCVENSQSFNVNRDCGTSAISHTEFLVIHKRGPHLLSLLPSLSKYQAISELTMCILFQKSPYKTFHVGMSLVSWKWTCGRCAFSHELFRTRTLDAESPDDWFQTETQDATMDSFSIWLSLITERCSSKNSNLVPRVFSLPRESRAKERFVSFEHWYR